MRMTERELVSQPRWKHFSGLKDARGLEHPPLCGRLAVPILRQTGKFIGVLQLSDRYEGDFTEEDQRLLTRLANVVCPTFDLHYVNRELERRTEQLAEIAARERRRLGRELHDSLGQKLTGLTFIAKSLKQKLERNSPKHAEFASAMFDLAKDSLADVRDLARSACRSPLTAHGVCLILFSARKVDLT